MESICCDIQTCLTSLQDQVRLDQLDEWLAKLTEDSLEVRAEYLEESSSRSSSSSSYKNTRSYQRKPGDAKDPAFKQSFQWQNVLGMEPRITDTLPRESDACREENKSRVRVDTSRKEDIEKWINSSGNHSDPKLDLWCHLEKIPFPKFAGNKMKYEEWKARFKVCVDSTDSITIYKLVQLKSLLRGEAEELLEGLVGRQLIMKVLGKS